MAADLEKSGFVSFKGQFLMAMPELADPNFAKTVTLICEHTPEGAFGLVINRPHALVILEQVFKEFNMAVNQKIAKSPIYMGGPVHGEEIYILHGPPFDWRGALQVTPTLAVTNTMDLLEALAVGTGPFKARMMLGCAGWGPGQLEQEIRENAWLTQDASDRIVFQVEPDDCWEEAVKSLGIDPLLLSSGGGNA